MFAGWAGGGIAPQTAYLQGFEVETFVLRPICWWLGQLSFLRLLSSNFG